jgi:hypothetical protein
LIFTFFTCDGGATEPCVTVRSCPPAVNDPVRVVPVALRANVKLTVPLPVPLAVVTVIQLVAVLAVHPHELALAVSVTDDVPPGPFALTEAVESVKVQGGGAAA